MGIKNFKQFITNESYTRVDISDYLKSSCRSWEYDCDNYDDTTSLANKLKDKFPNLSYDYIFNIAKDWTGYEEKEEE